MTDFEQPDSTKEKGTKVYAFELNNGSLKLTIDRASVKRYSSDHVDPEVSDIPPDYLAAITTWIARGLR